VSKGKLPAEQHLPRPLEVARDRLVAITRRMAALQEIVPDEHERHVLNFALIEVAYQWASGQSFHEVCKLTPLLEGDIVRNISRLDEVCKEVKNAARVLGNASLYQKLESLTVLIKRGIILSASLYTT